MDGPPGPRRGGYHQRYRAPSSQKRRRQSLPGNAAPQAVVAQEESLSRVLGPRGPFFRFTGFPHVESNWM